ncbi:AraC family transcriptional regulator [Marinobacter mobilis]|uniref:Helix-turn-helix domain-containing protein n=1 Tax=Marinobacter mobilis TaxID=488533 RepID=A0A1H2XU02_9GAMM|nr:AraC family transcriptional regulator [Marinobacter mobilis]SDW96078.1 Helix-turn-helix domain-containing protein [Marinobacter mobilis]
MSSLIRATNLWGYDEQVRRKGGDPLPLLSRYHIPPSGQRDDASFLVFKHLTELLEDTAAELADPTFGMMLAEYQGMDILGPISVIARSSKTVGEAINSIAGYLHLHCPALALTTTQETVDGDPMIRFRFMIDGEGEAYRIQAHELSLANAVQVMKLLCGNDFQPLSVHFMHNRTADESIYRKVYRCEPHFGQDWSGFYLPLTAFAMPLSSADHQTWQMAKRYLDSQQAPNANSLSEDVSRLINSLLPTGHCSSEAIAAHLSMHKRTLQRRLAREGTTYEQLLSDERCRLARQYLQEPNLGFAQITGLLGYSEQSTFTRACRDWFQLTPKAYRKHWLR